MAWRVNGRTGVPEWVPDSPGAPQPQNQVGSFTPEQAQSQPVGTPTTPLTPRQPGDPTLGADWYDPSAAALGRRPGFAREQFQKYDDRGMAADARQAPQVDYRTANESRMYSNEGRGLMGQRAIGMQSPAQRMMLQGLGTGMGNNIGAAASARGGPQMAALAARNAQTQNANMYTSGMNEYQRLRADEMENARNAYFGATSGQRGMDLQRSQYQSDLDMQQRAANDARMLGFVGLGQQTLEKERDAVINQQDLLFGDTDAAMQQRNRTQAQMDRERQQGIDTAMRMTEGFGRGALQTAQSNPSPPPRRRNPYDPYDPGY